jgi:hypothetical protein
LKIGVVAHQARIRQADKLVKDLKADAISVDRGNLGPQINHCKTWAKLARVTADDEYAVVLEDDSLPCKDFRTEAGFALRAAARSDVSIASFYLGRQRPIAWQDRVAQAVARAKTEGAAWIVGDAVLHGVAVVLRGNMIRPVLDFLTAMDRMLPIDEALTSFARRNYIECWYTWPSIVEHADTPTLIAHPDGEKREPGRVAWQFGTRFVWTSRKVEL